MEDTAATLITAGKLNIADVDTGESSFVAQASAAGTYGTFALNADGNWTYSANNSQAAIQQLGAGQTLTDSFTAVSKDGTATQTVSITITGTNDTPALGFYQGFEAGKAGILDGASGWYGNVARSVNSGDGITAVDGGKFAVFSGAAPDDTGPFTRFDGYRSDFVEGLTSEVKVYLNTDWTPAKGSTTRLRPAARTARICVTSSSTLPRIARPGSSWSAPRTTPALIRARISRRCTTTQYRRAAGSRCSTCSTMSAAISRST